MKSRPLTQFSEIEEIIQKCDHCNVAMIDLDHKPYVLPMNFGYHDGILFLHSAPAGKKIDILRQHPETCCSFSTDHLLRWQDSTVGCSYSMKYRSALLYGKIEFVTDFAEKEQILHHFMQHFGAKDYRLSAPAIGNVCVMKMPVERFEGRAYGY